MHCNDGYNVDSIISKDFLLSYMGIYYIMSETHTIRIKQKYFKVAQL